MNPREPAAAAALALAGALALAFPPQVHPGTGVVIALLLAAGLALAAGGVRAGVVAGGLVLAVANLAISLAPSRTAAALVTFALPIGAYALTRAVAPASRRLAWLGLALVGAAEGVLAVAQRAFLLAREAAAARAAGAPEAMVQRLAQGRPFGTHELPAALAGALLVALAACGVLAAGPERRRWLAVPAALAFCGFAATGSIGGVIALLAGAAVLVVPGLRTWPRRRIAWTLAACAAVIVLVVALRPLGDLGFARPDHPLRLRLGNWRGAVLVAQEQPFAGVGLGAFGALYPHVRRAGDLETIFAHDSWLQLAVELGLPGLVLLAFGVRALWRRVRRHDLPPGARWALAGVVAFAAHNLLDFTLYLPGVAVPAAMLAGAAFARDGVPRGRSGSRAAGALVLAVLLAGSGAAWWFDGRARAEVERAAASVADGDAPAAIASAERASALAVFDVDDRLAAGRALLAASLRLPPQDAARARALDAARTIATDLERDDPASPAPWHLSGDVELALGRPTAAWTAWQAAQARHPADARLAADLGQLGERLRAGGLFAAPLAYGGVPARPTSFDWELWDLLLLALQLILLSLAVRRWIRPGPASATALGLVFVVLASAWGEGGALPGARFGRMIVIAVSFAALLWPRRVADDPWAAPSLPREALWTLVPPALWAVLSAVRSPDPAAARDGAIALVASLLVLALSWQLSRENDAWPDVVLWVFAASAALAGALWFVQKSAALLGIDLSSAEVPLRADRFRPAADFLHPGHLGTYLVAAGLGMAGFALGQAARWRVRWSFVAGALVLAGLAGGARASLLALAAGGTVLALATGERRLRRIVAGLVGLGVLAGGGAVLWRFAAGDPFAYSRLGIWRAALSAFADRPLTGFGPGGFASFASHYAFRDPSGPASFGKSFFGPHSDLIAALVDLGLPGALLLLGALASIFWVAVRVVRVRDERAAVHAGLLAAVAALAAHGLVDDFLDARPAAAIAAAVLLGAVAGRNPAARVAVVLGHGTRVLCTVAVATVLLAGEALPWLADNVLRAGHPERAASIDPARPGYWIAAARVADGPAEPRLVAALDRTGRALLDQPLGAEPRAERAAVLEAACRGPLAETVTCGRALEAWDAAIEARPSFPLYRRARARLAAMLGRGAEAERDLRAALALETNFLGARLDLVRVLAEAGQTAAARSEFDALGARVRALAGTRPASPYEAALLALDPAEIERMRASIAGR